MPSIVPIDQLYRYVKNNVVDVLGIIIHVDELVTVFKNGRRSQSRSIRIVDATNWEVKIQLRGADAQNPAIKLKSTLVYQGALVSNYDGKSLISPDNGHLRVDADIQEANALKNRYKTGGKYGKFSFYNY